MLSKKFRTDISFLRVLAVISVMLYHFKVPFITGGLLGVDVFFVISGYLMTEIILTKINSGSFNILDFYKRRIQRIIPALLFLIILLSGFSFLFLRDDIKQFFRYSFFSELFISNLFYIGNSGYFDNSSQNNILLHTWSLSVEWQFYIIYPLILLLFRKIYLRNNKLFFFIFCFFVILSLLTMLYYSEYNTILAFYSLSTRAWELLIGGVVYLVKTNWKIEQSQKTKIWLSISSYFAILFCILFINDNDAWPSYYTIIPVLATAVLLFVNGDYKLYRHRLVIFTGNISYSLYLWHWPLFVIFQYFGIQYTEVTIVILIILSFAFASLSYFLIEKNKHLQSVWKIISLVFILAAAHYFLFKIGIDKYMKADPEFKNDTTWDTQTRQKLNCNMGMNGDGTYNKYNCLSIDPKRKNILLIGDSHAGSIAMSLQEDLQLQNINLLQMTYTGDTPLYNRKYNNKNFRDLTSYLFREFVPNNKIDLVIISLYYSKQKSIMKELDLTKALLNRLNIPVILVGETESYKINYLQIQKLKKLYPTFINEKNYLTSQSKYTNEKLKKQYQDDYLDIYEALIKTDKTHLYMSDTNHFTKFGADQVANKIMNSKTMATILKTKTKD